MRYRVKTQPRARAQLWQQYIHIAQENPQAATAWFNGLLKAIKGLAQNPERCALAHESAASGVEIRQLLFGRRSGKRRILFLIEGREVRIVAIRHSAQSDIPPEEISP